jgi:hypothetical protein
MVIGPCPKIDGSSCHTATLPVLALALLITHAGRADARLGEAPEECAARYGSPMSFQPSLFEKNTLIGQYYKDEISIRIYFNDGRAGAIRFSEIRTDEQVQKLLDANAQGHAWKELPRGDYRKWSRSDGGDAELVGVELLVRSGEAVAAIAAEKKRAEEADRADEAERDRKMKELRGF